MNPKERFSDRVENYLRYRPGYPDGVIDVLATETRLTADCIIADVGSGTGISSELFLRHGCTVYGVEPNAPMREAAERLLERYSRFHSVAGAAEATTLPAASADFVVAGQAFHWFDPVPSRAELARILRPGGWVVLLWNTRLVDVSPFLQSYEELLHEYATDYAQIDHRNVEEARLRAFFGGGYRISTFANHQDFDLEGLRGRLLSSSYVPNAGHARYGRMLEALEQIFTAHQRDGRVRFEYRTDMFFGRLS